MRGRSRDRYNDSLLNLMEEMNLDPGATPE